MANTRINVAELDFEGIRGNLKTFLRGQDRFKDFDYEGSNMAVLLDLLAYNTHYNALYTNMAVNELFLDSASKRSSVVSLARTLGYTPKSRTSARAQIAVTLKDVPGNPEFIVLPRYTKFIASNEGNKYTFNTVGEYSAARDSQGFYTFSDIELVEGTPGSLKFIATNDTRFVIPSTNVDTTTLRVKVQDSSIYKDFTFFVQADRESKIDGTKEVYFLRETFEGFTEIVFGDGVFGKSLQDGNIVTIDYITSSGPAANNIKRGFTIGNASDAPGTVTNIILLSQDKGGTYGGAEKEGIEEIRFNAPNLYASQGRAVTALDYESLITEKVPTIDQCVVWGGEKNVPPVYGKVFISAKTRDEQLLTLAEKERIVRDVIEPMKVLSVVTEFVDPAYIKVLLDIRVYYDPNKTASKDSEIASFARQVAVQYSENELERYNKIFRKSQLSRLIELSDDGILSTTIRTKLKFEIMPQFSVAANYEVKTYNPMVPGTLSSEPFYMAGVLDETGRLRTLFFDDDSAGNVGIYWFANGTRTYRNTTAGTIDYTTGRLTLTNLKILNVTTPSTLVFTATASSDDVAGFNNNIVLIDKENIAVSAIRDVTNERDASSFVFTANRI